MGKLDVEELEDGDDGEERSHNGRESQPKSRRMKATMHQEPARLRKISKRAATHLDEPRQEAALRRQKQLGTCPIVRDRLPRIVGRPDSHCHRLPAWLCVHESHSSLIGMGDLRAAHVATNRTMTERECRQNSCSYK